MLPHSEHIHHFCSIVVLQYEHFHVGAAAGLGLAGSGGGCRELDAGLLVRSITV